MPISCAMVSEFPIIPFIPFRVRRNRPGAGVDEGGESIRRFAQETVAGATGDVEKAVRLCYRVRDGWRYDPFTMSLDPEPYVASNALQAKATLLAAAATGCSTASRRSDPAACRSGDRLIPAGIPPIIRLAAFRSAP